MEITEIRIKLMESNNERLQAFCSVTFDNMFVVRDLKIIEGTKGSFVAMPSRKLTDRCPHCGFKNHLRANHCNQCGDRLNHDRAMRDMDGRAKLHADIAHPINSSCREFIHSAVISAFREEIEKAKEPGYVCRYDEIDAGDYDDAAYEYVIGGLGGARQSHDERRQPAHSTQPAHSSRFANEREPVTAGAGKSNREESHAGSFGDGIF